MNRYKFISALTLSAAAALPAAGAAPGHEAITTQQIANAMTGVGMQVSAAQVQLLSDVVSTVSTPRLRVQSMQRWGDDRMKVRMNCENAEECLPFFVAVRWSQPDATESAPTELVASILPIKPGPRNFVVRSGTLATLLLDSARVHIRVSVVCLENGAPGQVIRVSSKDHKQFYNAQVVDGGLLKGRL